MFDLRCREQGIEHRCTRVNHPWTNGQVERMNRTIKEATVQRYHYDSHEQLERHLDDFVSAYNLRPPPHPRPAAVLLDELKARTLPEPRLTLFE
jgi:transposase InsO family protein